MIKFPLVDNATTTNNPQLCSCCQQALTQQDDEVWLMLGALQGSSQLQHSDVSGQLFAFFSLQQRSGASVDVVHNGLGGQADIGFCSSRCLRAFFNHCVDSLEQGQVDD